MQQVHMPGAKKKPLNFIVHVPYMYLTFVVDLHLRLAHSEARSPILADLQQAHAGIARKEFHVLQ